MFEFINGTIPKQRRESSNGNREYKMCLDISNNESKTELRRQRNKSDEYIHHLRQLKLNNKINKRASQLHYRLEEGHGRALYMLGIRDDGTVEGVEIEKLFNSLNFLYKMVEIINAKVKNIRIYRGANANSYIATVRIEIPNYKPKQSLLI